MQVHDVVHITTRDRVLRAWQNTMELIRDFQLYAKEISDPTISDLFSRFAEDEGHHAAAFHDVLKELEGEKGQ